MISIIIPVFNAEKYIRQCLDSVVNQTLKDIEIICVNDGSTDGSLAILEEYEAREPRLKLINQENCGLSKTRNRAMKHANGEYIQFLDADDWLREDTCKVLLSQALRENLDMLSFGALTYYEDTGLYGFEKMYNFSYLSKTNIQTIPEQKLWHTMTPTSCLTLYRKKFLLDNNFQFEDNLNFEDCLFFKKALFASKKININKEALYFRRRHSESIVANGGRHYMDFIRINYKIVHLARQNNIPEEEIRKFLEETVPYTRQLFKTINPIYQKDFYGRMRRYFICFFARLPKKYSFVKEVLKYKNLSKYNRHLAVKKFFNSLFSCRFKSIHNPNKIKIILSILGIKFAVKIRKEA